MKIKELHDFLGTIAPKRENTVDQILFGDPDMEIGRVATCWMPYLDTLQKAYELGCTTVVCHEPLEYAHRGWDGDYCDVKDACQKRGLNHALALYQSAVDDKREWLGAHGMAVVRSHDGLDAAKGFGTVEAFSRLLGLDSRPLVEQRHYLRVFDVEGLTAMDLAKDFAKRLAPLHQSELAFYGDPEYAVSAVGIGTGCCCDPVDLLDMGADFIVTINDTVKTWIQCAFARDTGIPLVVIDHGASEEAGVRELCEHLREKLSLDAIHIPQGAGHTPVRAE